MTFKIYENDSMRRIEALLERLLTVFEGRKEEKEIEKCLKDIEKDQNEIKGGDFL